MEIRAPHTNEEWESYFSLRYQLLRKPWNQIPGSEKDDLELYATHRAVYIHGKAIAVGRLEEKSRTTGQIRFMAVLQSYQGQGIGNALLKELEEEAWRSGKSNIVLHAREKAVTFYRKAGYQVVRKSHVLFGEIQHFLLQKRKE